MVKVFDKATSQTTTDIVEDTLKVDASGNVTFRASRGKGSGRAVNIPGDQFDTFVSLLTETATRRQNLAEQAADTTSNDDSSDETTSDSEIDSE